MLVPHIVELGERAGLLAVIYDNRFRCVARVSESERKVAREQ